MFICAEIFNLRRSFISQDSFNWTRLIKNYGCCLICCVRECAWVERLCCCIGIKYFTIIAVAAHLLINFFDFILLSYKRLGFLTFCWWVNWWGLSKFWLSQKRGFLRIWRTFSWWGLRFVNRILTVWNVALGSQGGELSITVRTEHSIVRCRWNWCC